MFATGTAPLTFLVAHRLSISGSGWKCTFLVSRSGSPSVLRARSRNASSHSPDGLADTTSTSSDASCRSRRHAHVSARRFDPTTTTGRRTCSAIARPKVPPGRKQEARNLAVGTRPGDNTVTLKPLNLK